MGLTLEPLAHWVPGGEQPTGTVATEQTQGQIPEHGHPALVPLSLRQPTRPAFQNPDTCPLGVSLLGGR